VTLVDTTSPTGELVLNVLGSIAQFERQIMLERQREGIATAKAEKLYKGRRATAQQHKDTILKLHSEGWGWLRSAAVSWAVSRARLAIPMARQTTARLSAFIASRRKVR